MDTVVFALAIVVPVVTFAACMVADLAGWP